MEICLGVGIGGTHGHRGNKSREDAKQKNVIEGA